MDLLLIGNGNVLSRHVSHHEYNHYIVNVVFDVPVRCQTLI